MVAEKDRGYRVDFLRVFERTSSGLRVLQISVVQILRSLTLGKDQIYFTIFGYLNKNYLLDGLLEERFEVDLYNINKNEKYHCRRNKIFILLTVFCTKLWVNIS